MKVYLKNKYAKHLLSPRGAAEAMIGNGFLLNRK